MKKENKWIDGKAITFAIFVLAGNFKADPRLSWLPIDLTVLSAGATLLYMGMMFVKSRYRVPVSSLWICGLFATFLLPVMWTEFTDYGVEKMMKLFSFTFLCAVAPLYLFKTDADLRRLWNAFTVMGVLMAFDAIVAMLLTGGLVSDHDTNSGITAFGSNTIALGRTTGIALIWVVLLGLEKKKGLGKSLLLVGILVFALVGSGSRGPLLSTFSILGLTAVLFHWKRAVFMGRLTGAILIISLVCLYGYTIVPDKASTRIGEFLSGEWSNSELMRMKAYELSWEKIKETPEGTGWGGFATTINLWPDSTRQYPHNLFLEIGLEGGWLAGLLLCMMMAVGLWHVFRGATTVERRACFALLLFVIGNAMISGDVNDNKEFFALWGLSLGFPGSINKLGEDKNE